MRNYLKRLRLADNTAPDNLDTALANLEKNILDKANTPQWQNDAMSTLSDETRRQYYSRMHLQHRTLKAAIACLNSPVAKDSNRWFLRLEEFDPPEELSEKLPDAKLQKFEPAVELLE